MSFREFEGLSIASIPPGLDEATRLVRGQQLGNMMGHVQFFYTDTLGLTRIDPDDPPGSESDVAWRADRLQKVGPVQEKGLEIIAAVETTDDGNWSDAEGAMQGLLVLSKPEGLCTPEGHQVTEILEWDVKPALRGLRIGSAMLAGADIHPQDSLILDVAENNIEAQQIYTRYGFIFDPAVEPMEHGVFDTRHLRMRSRGDLLQHAVNFDDLANLVDTLSPEELAEHPVLWSAYSAAQRLVMASYNGHINTSRVEFMADNTVTLARRIINRFREGGNGHVVFPSVIGDRTSKLITASVDDYSLVRNRDHTGQPQAYFSMFASRRQQA